MARNVVGIPFQNPGRYVSPYANLIPIVRVSRAPTTSDKKYPLGQFWMVGSNPSTGTEGDLWYLCDFTSGNATWCQVAVGAGSPGIDTVTGDGGTAVSPDGSGNVDWNAATVANGTNAKPLYINDATANTIIPQLQLSAAITGAPADGNDAGIASFDDTAFAVDANGYVTLVGGGSSPALLSLDVDGNSGAGTDPVVANGSGLIALTGSAVANATYASPVFTNSGAANSATVAVQVGAAVTGAPGDKLDAGLVSFDDTAFAVDGDGYVTLVGGGTTPAMVSLDVDGNTGPGTDPVVANGSAQITLTGSTVANATNATPVFTHSRAANTANVEVQVAAAVTGAPGDKNDAGLASFDDSYFSVDSDGYVSLTGLADPGNPWISNATGAFRNLGISYDGGTGVFTVSGDDGTALSSSNPAEVYFADDSTPGYLSRFNITANQSFTDDVGTSDIAGNLLGMSTGIATSVDIPVFLYAATDGTNITFGLSRVPNLRVAPAAASIGTPSSAVADTQGSLFLFDSVTVANYEANPVCLIGSFRMRMSASDDWTVQTLDDQDGCGRYNDTREFTVPTQHWGANSGTYTIPNGGTAAVFTTSNYFYCIKSNGQVEVRMYLTGDGGTDGSGAVSAQFTLPFIMQGTRFQMPIRWKVGAGTYQTGMTAINSGSNLFAFSALSSGTEITWASFTNGDRRFETYGSYTVAN